MPDQPAQPAPQPVIKIVADGVVTKARTESKESK